MERITIEQASEILGIPPQAVRVAMQQGKLPIGVAIKSNKRWSYYLWREKVVAFALGKVAL